MGIESACWEVGRDKVEGKNAKLQKVRVLENRLEHDLVSKEFLWHS